MTLIAIYDLESNGLLTDKREKDGSIHPALTKLHTETFIGWNTVTGNLRYISACDQPGYAKGMRHWVEEQTHTDDLGKVHKTPVAHMLEPGEDSPDGSPVWERMPLIDGLNILALCDLRVGHNIQDFDERAIPMVYPWWKPKPDSNIRDTLIMSRCIYPDIYKTGPNGHKVYGFLKNAHSLKAWGMRLGEHKGDYKGGWMEWSEGMQRYGEQDTIVVFKLFKWLLAQKPSPEMLDLEHSFAAVIRRQEARGFAFDYEGGTALFGELQSTKADLEAALIDTFGSWWSYKKVSEEDEDAPPKAPGKGHNRPPVALEDDEEYDSTDPDVVADLEDPEEQAKRFRAWDKSNGFSAATTVPSKTRKVKMVGVPDITKEVYSEKTGKRLKDYVGPPFIHYTMGAPYTPIKRMQFNPGSRTQVIMRLKAQFGWTPSKFTKKLSPIVDDAVLRALPWPEAQKLADYFLVNKRIGQLATGKKAWLKVAVPTEQPNGKTTWRIHGRINTNGAGTGRCTHSDPNVAQVPKNTAEAKNPIECVKGFRYRALFGAAKGYDLVGFDGAALELRMLAHYVFKWDAGEYAKIVDEGRKEDQTDPHSWLCKLIGEDLLGPVTGQGRDHAKTAMYAELYGAGAEKMGAIVEPQATKERKIQLGGQIKRKMESRFTAKASLQDALTTQVEEKGSIPGLDKRKLYVRKAHAALNTLLQSAGAVTMKKALVLLDASLQAHGMIAGRDYEFVANIHDEAQAEVLPQFTPLFKRLAEEAMIQAGLELRLKCPLKAEASSGHTWAETH